MKKTISYLLAAVLLAAAAPAPAPARAATSTRESLAYLFGGSTNTYISNVDKTKGNLTVVCPDYFELSASGALKLTRPIDAKLISEMHARGIRVTPFLSNQWDRALGRLALSKRVALADALVNQVVTHNLDGVDIDLENLNQDDRGALTDFMRILREKLPSDKTLTIAVAANPNDWKTGWQGSYDYAALAPLVDHVFMMTYDESYSGGPAGPVSSYGFVERSVQYALKHVPAEKLMIGLPFYGRYWRRGASSGGQALTLKNIEQIVSLYPSTVEYDSKTRSPHAIVTLSASNAASRTWGGRTLAAGTYDFWYENADSYQEKLSLVEKYDIRGVGSWALGQEPAWLWDYYSTWLSGMPFSDIRGTWAQEYIERFYFDGIAEGISESLFGPNEPITRADAVVMICRILGIAEAPQAPDIFYDMDNSHPSRGYVLAAAQAGLLAGYPDGSFRPDQHMSRAEVSVVVAKAFGITAPQRYVTSDFFDLYRAGYSWCFDAIMTLRHYGIISGYPDGSFRPKDTMTRAEAVRLFAAAMDA